MRKSGRFWVAAAALCVIVGIVAFGFATAHAGFASDSTIPLTVSPNAAGLCVTKPTAAAGGPVTGGCIAPTPIRATGPNSPGADAGVSAISPQMNTTDPATPTFDAKTVQAYIAAHPPGGRVHASGAVTVASVQFITAGQAEAQLGTQSGLASTRLICLVKLTGTFTLSGPANSKPGTIPTLYQAYDAHTGNFLYQQSG